MTEDEYILVSDLKTVRHALTLLRDIVPANSSVIELDAYHAVLRTLYEWERKLSEEISELPPQETEP